MALIIVPLPKLNVVIASLLLHWTGKIHFHSRVGVSPLISNHGSYQMLNENTGIKNSLL